MSRAPLAGIGRAIAVRRSRRTAAVAACDRDEVLRPRPTVALRFTFDVTDADAVATAFQRPSPRSGRCRPWWRTRRSWTTSHLRERLSPRSVAARVLRREPPTGAFLTVQQAIAGMRERRAWPGIVAISSVAATGGLRGQVSYSAAKAGLLGMVRTLAAEWGPRGIRCNAVMPGMIATPKVRAMPAPARDGAMTQIPLGRFGEPDGAGRRRRLPALAGGGVHQRNGPQGRRRARPVDAMTRAPIGNRMRRAATTFARAQVTVCHWFNPITRTTSDQLRQALMLSTTARSKP